MYIDFSDAAKFADIARNLVNGFGFNSSFSFWSVSIHTYIKEYLFSGVGIPPVTPYTIALFFKIFGVTDFAVLATSAFYFLLLLVFVFLLAKKIFKSNLVGILSVLAVGLNVDLITYAKGGASESPFIFEIVAASYFASLKKKWANIVTFALLVLMYLTRSQAFIYIAGIFLYQLILNFKLRKAILIFIAITFIGFLADYFILLPNSGRYFLYSIIGRGMWSSFNQSGVASDALRGAGLSTFSAGIFEILKNTFYNLYNFYKALPNILSPYLFGIYLIGYFIKSKTKEAASFKIASLFMVLVTFIVTAASIPFYRYIHPVIPLVYILGIGATVELLKLYINKQVFLIIASFILIFTFGMGQTLGVLFLDSRFERNTHNVGKPPVYVELSKTLKENTKPTDIVVTNLDTWGSWYGERKTIWFPVEPKQLIDPNTGDIPFDAIYLTSYLIDDQNYKMGENWRLIFDNPKDSKKWICDGCKEIAKEYILKGLYSIDAADNYERQDANAILLVKNK